MKFSEKISISSVHSLNQGQERNEDSLLKKEKTLTETVRVFFSYAS